MKRLLLLALLTSILCAGEVEGQSKDLKREGQQLDTLFDQSSKTFLVVPLVTNSPAMDTGFGVMPLYFFKLDKEDEVSPPSLIGLYALYTTNQSYIAAPFGRFFWNEDRNRATVMFGTARVNHDFVYDELSSDLRLVYSEIRNYVVLGYNRKVFSDFYIGALYYATQTRFAFDKGSDFQNAAAREFFRRNGIEDNFFSSVGLSLSFDNRDYPYYPTTGLQFNVRPKFYTSWLGSENEYMDTAFDLTFFKSFHKRLILAGNISAAFATGDVPFAGYQVYGIRNTLRGYPAGKYRGRNMIAGQVELRWAAYKRWGAVAFGGLGSVWGNERNGEEEFERDRLPSAGLGIRYRVSEAKKINLRLDFAVGVDGNQGIHFGVMEAF